MRQTPIRNQLISLFQNHSSPLSAPEILRQVKANKTTIYRELDFLLLNKVISEVDFADGLKRYESAVLPHHHHLICVNCKSVTDADLKVEKLILSKSKFKVLKHDLEFFGLCSRCQ